MSQQDWSKVETSKTGFGRNHFQKVLKGLACTDVELWEKKVIAESEYYREQAIKSGDAGPQIQVSAISVHVDRLKRLDAEKLTCPINHRAFVRLRSNAVHQAAVLHQTTEDARLTYEEGQAGEAKAEPRGPRDRAPDRGPSPCAGSAESRGPRD